MTPEDDDPRVRQLGQYIRLQRQMADLSLRGMADLTKVSNAYLSQIERGLHQPSRAAGHRRGAQHPRGHAAGRRAHVRGPRTVPGHAHGDGGGHPQRSRLTAGGAGGAAADHTEASWTGDFRLLDMSRVVRTIPITTSSPGAHDDDRHRSSTPSSSSRARTPVRTTLETWTNTVKAAAAQVPALARSSMPKRPSTSTST